MSFKQKEEEKKQEMKETFGENVLTKVYYSTSKETYRDEIMKKKNISLHLKSSFDTYSPRNGVWCILLFYCPDFCMICTENPKGLFYSHSTHC